MLKNKKFIACLIWLSMLFSYVSWPILWEHLTADVQWVTDINAEIKVAPPRNFSAHWSAVPSCHIETNWDVSNHCNKITSGINCFVDSYRLTWEDSSSGIINSTDVIPWSSTGFTITPLPCGNANYNLTLRSIFGTRESSALNASTNTPPVDATNLACSNIGINTLDLNWIKSVSPALNTQNLYQNGVLIDDFDNLAQTTALAGLTASTDYTFRLTSLNINGDESAGITVLCSTNGASSDTTPPTGSLNINNGATYTTSNLVNLTLTTDDAVQMHFSNNSSGPWSSYETYSNTKSNWDLNDVAYGGNSSQGTKSVFVQLKDNNNNETTGEITDSIIFDSLKPTSTVTPPAGRYASNQTLTLSSEAGATLRYATNVSGECPIAGAVGYTNYTVPFQIQNNVNEGKVCFYATDLAGNIESPINSAIYEIDMEAPSSYALPLPAYTTSHTFNVAYTTGVAPDLAYTELYYSYNGWAYQKYTNATYPDGHFFLSPISVTVTNDGTYAFYTRATDDLGNTEAIPTTVPDAGAQTIVDTIAPIAPTVNLDLSASFSCNNAHVPRCHTDLYDVLMNFTNNTDFAQIYISGDVTTDPGSTYYNNVNQWVPFSTNITVPLDPTVNPPEVSKNKIITFKVRDAAGNESATVSVEIRLWRSWPVLNSSDVTVQGCTMYNGICYLNNLSQILFVNASTPEERQYFEFYLSGSVNWPTANNWVLYKTYSGTIPFSLTSGDGTKNLTFQVRSPSGKLSNSVTKQVKLIQNAPTFSYVINPSICNGDSTPTLCKTYQNIIPLSITPGVDAVQMYISGNVDATNPSYGANVNTWIPFDTSKIIAVTPGLWTKNIYLKVRDIFNHESTEILRVAEVLQAPVQSEDEQPVDHGTAASDKDNDGMPDYWEEEYGFNPNNPYDAELDPDQDGLTNVEEYDYGSNPLKADTDGDGLKDGLELSVCPGILKADSDNDGLKDGAEIALKTDPCNSDSDGDGIKDGVEVESWTDPLDPSNKNSIDTDGDGIPDLWETKHKLNPKNPKDAYQDRDSDGLTNREEYEKGTNIDAADTDNDGLKDGVEVKQYFTDPLKADTDWDGLTDGQEVRNGTDPLDPADPGANQNDKDGNGIDDAWENQYYQDLPHSADWYKNRDTDKDGLSDYDEYVYGTNPLLADTDGDKLSDYEEVKQYSTNPNKKDSDGDELNDFDEVKIHKTDPNKKDTDGDKFVDGSEIQLKTNPLDPLSFPGDRDADGMPDQWEKDHGFNPDDSKDANLDPDRDGLSNRAEYQWSTDPRNEDTDGDGLSDGREVQIGTDPLDPDSKFPDENKNGVDDNWEMLYFNELRNDLGSRDFDGDGLSDKLEFDYKTNPLKQDTDGDELTDAEEIFIYGTDPLDPKSNKKYFAITNIKDNTFLSTGDPLLKGIAPPNGMVKIFVEDENNNVITSILTRADDNNVFMWKFSVDLNKEKFADIDLSKFKAETDNKAYELDDGKYYVYAVLYDNEGRERNQTKKLFVEIDATLNLAAPNPQYLSVEELTVDNFFQGVEVIICDRVPEVRGTTYFGSQVIATWRSLVLTSSLIADSDVGNFAIKSPKALEIGDHTVTLYAITPDGIRSPDLTIPFKITEESNCHKAAFDLLGEKQFDFMWLLLLLVFLITLFTIQTWKRTAEKIIVIKELQKLGYQAVKKVKVELELNPEAKVFRKKDPLKFLKNLLEKAEKENQMMLPQNSPEIKSPIPEKKEQWEKNQPFSPVEKTFENKSKPENPKENSDKPENNKQ